MFSRKSSLMAGVALVVAGTSEAQNNQLYLVTNNLCLTLSQDQSTVVLASCGQYAYQQWDLSSGERIQLGGYCLDAYAGPSGALQIKPCSGAPSQSWWFNQDGRVPNKAQVSGCLSTSGSSGATLFLGACGPQVSTFFSSRTPPAANLPSYFPASGSLPSYNPQPSLPTFNPQTGGLPSYNPQVPPPQILPPPLPSYSGMGQQLPPPLNSQFAPQQPPPTIQMPTLQNQPQPDAFPSTSTSMSKQIQQRTSGDLSDDHYLCTCIVDASAEACNDAVRAACTVGHLDATACRESFSRGDHDTIADDILQLIENGAKCSKFDWKQLKKEAQQRPIDLPKSALSGPSIGVPTAEDHYLCVCLDSKSSEKCFAAVKAACLVGHIPSGDCMASLNSRNHEGATDHILRLIDNGASCSQTLKQTQLSSSIPDKAKSTGMIARAFGQTPKGVSKDQRDLCTCLDDPQSALCGNAIKKACTEKRIPLADCQVAQNNHYLGGVTKHALKLIDHGAQCPAHRSMTFTNHGCHCLQQWTEGKKTYTFPNNCADPDGRKGYAWCKTFGSEHCAGVEGSVEWDRCDNPKFPIRRDEQQVDGNGYTPEGELGEEDHYLCVCLSQTSTDEVCVAAVKAACAVGHLPSPACKASFEDAEHSAVSDLVVTLLKGGASCKETLRDSNIYRPKEGETTCPDGYFGFPDCRKKVECAKKCSHGQQCDFTDGTCQCLPNFTGPACSQCAEGYSGRYCTPESQSGGGWTLGQGLVYLFLFAGLMYAAVTAYRRFGGRATMGITYSKLPGPEDEETGRRLEEEEDHSHGVAMATDLGSDAPSVVPPAASSPAEKPKNEYTGLAV